MEYVVIDEMCGVDKYFDTLDEAKKYALEVQGVLYEIKPDNSMKFILSYGDC